VQFAICSTEDHTRVVEVANELLLRAIGSGNPQVEAISTGATSHRGTFAKGVPQWKAWFDQL